MSTEPGGGDGDVARAATRVMATAAHRDLQPGDDVGGYRIEQVIGEGGMGTVYGAVHPVIGKRAAIKVLRRELCTSAEAIERFVQEARAVNQIGHPNIVDAFAFGTLPDGRSWCAMEWLVGESLADRIERRRLTWDEACAVLADVIRALEAAHAHGVVHRDLKPDNVFLVEVADDRPRVKLLDFGIAKLTGGRDQRVEKTRTGALVGTPLYIAPEQARGQAVDARTDVYSLGVMTFELFAGRVPFDADNAADLIAKHLTETPPRLRSLAPQAPAAVDAIVAAMLAKDPAARPSLAEVKAVLASAKPVAQALSEAPTPPAKPAAIAAVAPVKFAPAPEAPLELAADPRATRTARAAARPAPHVPPSRGTKVLAIVAGAIVFAGGVAIAFVLGGRHGDHARATASTASPAATPVEPDHAAPAPAPAPTPAPPAADATLDVTLTGAPRATITIDGATHDLWKGAPAMIPVAAGRHDVTVTADGYETFHTTIDASAGHRVALLAKLTR